MYSRLTDDDALGSWGGIGVSNGTRSKVRTRSILVTVCLSVLDRISDVDKIIPIVSQNSRSSVAFSEGRNVVADGASGTMVIVVGGVSVTESVSMMGGMRGENWKPITGQRCFFRHLIDLGGCWECLKILVFFRGAQVNFC